MLSYSLWLFESLIVQSRYYAGLGVIDDFSDELIIWAYKRQCETDPTNRPYLFECLEKIAQSRVTEALQVEVATQRSQGAFTLEEVFAAARALGIENVDTAEESLIIGTFQARLLDAPRQELTMRHQLDIIGQYRNSHTILAVAQKSNALGLVSSL
jgi:ubiquitin carboxyl-terminal hydrolase 25/28